MNSIKTVLNSSHPCNCQSNTSGRGLSGVRSPEIYAVHGIGREISAVDGCTALLVSSRRTAVDCISTIAIHQAGEFGVAYERL